MCQDSVLFSVVTPVAGSGQGFSYSRQSCFILVFCRDKSPPCVETVFCSLSRQCHERGSLIATENFSSTIGFRGVVSR